MANSVPAWEDRVYGMVAQNLGGWEDHTNRFKMCPVGNKEFPKFLYTSVSQIYTELRNSCLLIFYCNFSFKKSFTEEMLWVQCKGRKKHAIFNYYSQGP